MKRGGWLRWEEREFFWELRIWNVKFFPRVIEFVVALEKLCISAPFGSNLSNFARNERWMMEIEDLPVEIESWEFEGSVCTVSWNFSFRGNRVHIEFNNLSIRRFKKLNRMWRSNVFFFFFFSLLYLSSMLSLFTINFLSMWNTSHYVVITLIQFLSFDLFTCSLRLTLKRSTFLRSFFFFFCLQFLPAQVYFFPDILWKYFSYYDILYRKR